MSNDTGLIEEELALIYLTQEVEEERVIIWETALGDVEAIMRETTDVVYKVTTIKEWIRLNFPQCMVE